jgi:hypothetical protein
MLEKRSESMQLMHLVTISLFHALERPAPSEFPASRQQRACLEVMEKVEVMGVMEMEVMRKKMTKRTLLLCSSVLHLFLLFPCVSKKEQQREPPLRFALYLFICASFLFAGMELRKNFVGIWTPNLPRRSTQVLNRLFTLKRWCFITIARRKVEGKK